MNANYAQWYNEMNSLRWDISNKIDSLNEQVVQNAKLSFDESVLIQKYNESDSTADVEISYHLKEYTAGEIVKVAARGQSGQTYGAMATHSNMGRFFANMTLPVRDNYILTFTTEGETIRSGELTRFDLADRLTGYERFKYNLSCGTSSGGNEPTVFTIQPDFSNNIQGGEALIINEISLSLESNSELVVTWDLLPYLQNTGNTQELRLDDYNWERLRIYVGSEIGQIELNSLLVARLTMCDKLGVMYERADPVFAYWGDSPNSGGGGGTVSPPQPAPPATDDAGYAWGVFRIVSE
jgi:hypothetical protein